MNWVIWLEREEIPTEDSIINDYFVYVNNGSDSCCSGIDNYLI